MEEVVTESSRYGYPLKVHVDFNIDTQAKYKEGVWNYFNLLEPPSRFVHLQFRPSDKGFVHERNGKKFWVNAEAIDSILIQS